MDNRSLSDEHQKLISDLAFDSLTLMSLMWKSDWGTKRREKAIYDFASNLIVIPMERSFSLFVDFGKRYKNHWDELISDLTVSNPLETRLQREFDENRYENAKEFLIKCFHVLAKLCIRNLDRIYVGSNFKDLKIGAWRRLIVFDPQCYWLYLFNFSQPIYQFSDKLTKVEKLFYSTNNVKSEQYEIVFKPSFDEVVEKLLKNIPEPQNKICLLEFQREIDIAKLKSDIVINKFILQQFQAKGWKGDSNILAHYLEIDGNRLDIPGTPEFDVFVFKDDCAIIIETKRRKRMAKKEKDNVTKFFAFFSMLKNSLLDINLTGIFLSTGDVEKYLNIPIYGSNFHVISPEKFDEILSQFIGE